MSAESLSLIAACVFHPGDVGVDYAYMRNCYGDEDDLSVPGSDGDGEYYFSVDAGNGLNMPSGSEFLANYAIVASAWNQAGDTRNVFVTPIAAFGDEATIFHVKIRDELGALTSDFTNCSVAIYRLPLV